MEERPPADPKRLLAYWMEWERGETPPGRVISNLKTAGLRDFLEQLAGDAEQGQPAADAEQGRPAAD